MKSQKITLSLLALIFGCHLFAQNAAMEITVPTEKEFGIHKNVQERTNAIFDSLVKIRRDFHRHPEVSEQEKRTSQKIADYLVSLGLQVETGIGGYGVVGILSGNKRGKRVAWRADIDAIATDLPDTVDFASKNEGVRHICGHDIHTTIGLGIADVLASLKDNLNGTVYFIFQPSEENFKGARAMIADGLFDIIDPDEIYGLHMSPHPLGTMTTKSENVYARRTAIEIKYNASTDQDALVDFTKKLMNDAQTYGPNAKFWDVRNLLSPEFGVASPNTIYKDYVALMSDFDVKNSGDTVRIRVVVDADTKERLDKFKALIENKIQTSEYSKALLSVKFNFWKGMPVMETPINNPKLTRETLKSISGIYGEQSVIKSYGVGPGQFSDDFTYFQKSVPGVYYFLGGSNFEKGIVAMPHTPNFTVDEQCIKTGVNFFSSMLIERLNQ